MVRRCARFAFLSDLNAFGGTDSPTLPTQLMDGNLGQKSMIIDVTPAIILILEGKLHQIQ